MLGFSSHEDLTAFWNGLGLCLGILQLMPVVSSAGQLLVMDYTIQVDCIAMILGQVL